MAKRKSIFKLPKMTKKEKEINDKLCKVVGPAVSSIPSRDEKVSLDKILEGLDILVDILDVATDV